MKLYHGTQVRNIEMLKPIATRLNAISKPIICFASNPYISLFYIWNRSYKWVAFREDENGTVVFTEHYDNMLYDFYSKVSGSIYECAGSNPDITPTHMKGVYSSGVPVTVEKETVIANVYDEVLKQEALGNIRIRRYNQLASVDKEKLFQTTVRAIHMQKLLSPSDYIPKQEQANFVKTHFPEEWDVALKMTRQEVEQMINEWRATVKG